MRWLAIGALIAILPACNESTRDSYLRAALSGAVKDASSLQFRDVTETHGLFCGEFKSQSSSGADQKFTVFVFDRAENVLRTEDDQEPDEYSAFYNDLRLKCSNGRRLLNELDGQVPVSNSPIRVPPSSGAQS
ncbi:MAG TPA: hypothetical protein VGU01_15215 [Sphingomicrobium sp.]|nr:hypothetical protein [Sphingomicrobium sp.]